MEFIHNTYCDTKTTLMALMVSLTYTLNEFCIFLFPHKFEYVSNCRDQILLISKIPSRSVSKKHFLKPRNSDFFKIKKFLLKCKQNLWYNTSGGSFFFWNLPTCNYKSTKTSNHDYCNRMQTEVKGIQQIK